MNVDGCPTCKLRSMLISPSVGSSTRTKRFAEVGKRKGNPSWEQAIVTDDRGMPLLKPDGHLIRQKEYAENRRSIEAGRRQLAQGVVPPSQ